LSQVPGLGEKIEDGCIVEVSVVDQCVEQDDLGACLSSSVTRIAAPSLAGVS